MPLAPIFSTYRQGENRVTGALMAVLARLPLQATDEIVGAMLGEQISLVDFTPLPATAGPGHPDARIQASVDILFEVKTKPGALKAAEALSTKTAYKSKLAKRDHARLILLTPDTEPPEGLSKIKDDRITWYSFAALASVLRQLLEDEDGQEFLSERDRFLVREFLQLLSQEKLLGGEDTLVLAAGHAYKWYLDHQTYICQPNRAFRDVKRMAFYTGKEIKPEVPQILHSRRALTLSKKDARAMAKSRAVADRQLGTAILEAIAANPPYEGATHDVYLLSAPDSSQTLNLDAPVPRTQRGPWTYGHRYVFEADLVKAGTTEELDELTAKRRS